jgi:hypothetical protein
MKEQRKEENDDTRLDSVGDRNFRPILLPYLVIPYPTQHTFLTSLSAD